jgi:hypothetical protein
LNQEIKVLIVVIKFVESNDVIGTKKHLQRELIFGLINSDIMRYT